MARGGYEVDIDWKNGRLSRAVVRSRHGGDCILRSSIPLKGKGLRKHKDANLYTLPTKAGEAYIIQGL